MVVRRRYARLVVDVCKNLETERRIFVKDLQPARNVVAAEFLDEILVGEQAFEILTDLFASRRAGIARKSGTAIADELVEVIGHGVPPGLQRYSLAQVETERQKALPQNEGGRTWSWSMIIRTRKRASHAPRSRAPTRCAVQAGTGRSEPTI